MQMRLKKQIELSDEEKEFLDFIAGMIASIIIRKLRTNKL